MGAFHAMAARVALGDPGIGDVKGEMSEDKGEKKSEEEFDPNWSKARNIVQSKLKPTVKDLEMAVKDKDKKLAEYLFERLLELATELAKGFGMAEFKSKLKTLEQKTFD